MTKGKLIELLKKIQRNEISSEDVFMLKELTDEEIDIVLNINNKNEIINLFKNENFKKIPKETKEIIIELLKKLKEGSIYLGYIIRMATNKNIIESGNLLEIIGLIAKTKEPHQIDLIISIASNPNAISSGKVLEICKLMSRRDKEREQLKIAGFAATDTYIIRSGNVVNVVKRIIYARNKEEALKIYYESINKYKNLTLLDSLFKGHINKINLWDMLLEEPEEAISLLVQLNDEDEINPEEKINKEKLGKSRTRKNNNS
ncbi:MAG: hypothetical protein IJE89_03045 [Bacilli bacterium]|nr:hypothetical protein [Bacilli bacterium]